MKLRNIFFTAICTCLVFSSCKKQFLELRPYDQIDQSQAILNESDMATAVNGIYAQFRNSNLFGRTLPLVGDLLADNVFISTQNSNRYLPEFNYTYNSQSANQSTSWQSA